MSEQLDQTGAPGTPREQLAEFATRGAEAGFEAVFAQHGSDVFRFCCALAGSAKAESLLVRTARRAASELQGHDPSSNPKRVLLRTAYEKAVAAEPTDRAEPSARPEPRDPAGAPIAARVDALPRTQRGGLVLRELMSLGYGPIADILKIDPDTARQRVSQARLTLQPQLPREGPMCDVARNIMADDQRDPAADAALTAHLATCPECPKVERSMSDLEAGLGRAYPQIEPAKHLEVLKEASGAATAAKPEAPEPSSRPRAGRSLRQKALAVAALVLLGTAAAVLGVASPLDSTTQVDRSARTVLPPAVVPPIRWDDDKRALECPRGTHRVRDHCEPDCPAGTLLVDERCVPECPAGSRRVEGECRFDPPIVDPCPPGTHPAGGRCERDAICLVGFLRNGRCIVPLVCPEGTVFSRGQCVLPGVCPRGTRRVRNGDCVLPTRCPRGSKQLSGGFCRGRIVCPTWAKRHGLECRLPVRCPKGATPVGRRCVLPAVCPKGTTPVRGTCELPPSCPGQTTPAPEGCLGEVVCPPRTVPRGSRCVRPCAHALRKLSDPCLDPRDPYNPANPETPDRDDPRPHYPAEVEHEDDGYMDRHGDRNGRGHRPGPGRGHDPGYPGGSSDTAIPAAPSDPQSEDPPVQSEPAPLGPAPPEPAPPAPAPASPPSHAPAPQDGDGRHGGRWGEGHGGRGRGRWHERRIDEDGGSHDTALPVVALLAASGLSLPPLIRRRVRPL